MWQRRVRVRAARRPRDRVHARVGYRKPHRAGGDPSHGAGHGTLQAGDAGAPGRHATWYGDDTQRSRAIALLNALLGSWVAGAASTPGEHGRARLPVPSLPHAIEAKVDNPGHRYPFAHETITTASGSNDHRKPYP